MNEKTFRELEYLYEKAEKKYGSILNDYDGLGALQLEFDEVKAAIQERKPWKVRAELLDVMNVAQRWVEAIDRGVK